MRRASTALALAFLAPMPGRCDTHAVQNFSGDAAASTPFFSVGDNWQVQWSTPAPVHLVILAADGTPIASVQGSARGNIYEKSGGVFSLKIESAQKGAQIPWRMAVVQFDTASAATQPTDLNVPNFADGSPSGPPLTGPGLAHNPSGGAGPVGSFPSTNFGSASPPAPDASALPPAKLTALQAQAIVVVKGDNAEGTGFLVKMPDGPVVVTNLHVLSNNPNIKLTTNSGDPITVLGLKGASDRDLAVLSIKDNNYSYLDLAADVSKVAQTGDQVVTPGNSEGGEVVLDTQGLVMGIGPQKIEFNNPIYHGNSGGPVFDAKNGKVLGVVTEAEKVDVSDSLDKASFSSRNSAITGSMRYFGLRLDTVPKWETYDWDRYQTETVFLEQFHHLSECLDSFLNGKNDSSSGDSDSDTPSANLYLGNDKIKKAQDDFNDRTAGADSSQRMDALRILLFDLEGIADSSMQPIQDMGNFYSFDQTRAHDEIDYRKALRKELDSIGNNVERLNGLAHSSN